MSGRRHRTLGWLARLVRGEDGTALIEFALIVPVMLMLYIGAIEASTLITMDRKVQSVAGAVGDLVARVDETISTSQIQDYFRAASGVMTPYSSAPVLQVVTAVDVDEDGNATVLWTRQYQNGTYSSTTPHVVGDDFPLPAEMIAVSKGRTVIAAEASYAYPPLFGLISNVPINLYRSSFFLPRFGGTISAPS